MSDEQQVIKLDFDYENWFVQEMHAFHKATGVNAAYAYAKIVEAQNADIADMRARIAEAEDDAGMPEGWQPLHTLNLDPDWVLGFAWMAARREQANLKYETFAGTVRFGELLQGLIDAMFASADGEDDAPDEDAGEQEDAEPAPFDTTETPPKTSPPSKTSASSRSASAGRSQKSGM